MLISRLRGDQRGSIPMALLAMIVVSAIVGVVTATVITGERQTRFDANYEASLQIAEAGIGQFVSKIKNNQAATMSTCSPGPTAPNIEARCISWTTVEGGRYQVRGDRDGGDNWTVLATGEAAGQVARRARVRLERTQPFRYALFADRNMNFVGSPRQAASFDSLNQLWTTGQATLATNANNLNAAQASYDQKPGTTNADIDVASDDAVAFITDAITNCQNAGTFPTPLPNPIPPGTYCVQNLNFSGTWNLTPEAAFDPADSDDPSKNAVKIYVTGNINIDRNASVNCGTSNAKCTWGSSSPNFPQPGALQIYSIGQGQVFFGNSSRISAGIYAPRAHCMSNPHAHVYGSLVCRAVGTFTGHFRLYYDEAMKKIYGPERRIWSEEPSA